MLRKIHLYGPLAKEFGAEHEFDVDTVAQTIGCLEQMLPGFRKSFRSIGSYKLIRSNGDNDLFGYDDSTLTMSLGKATDFHIVPDIQGSGPLIVAWVAGAAFAATTAGIVIATLINIGLALAVGALAMALSPSPKKGHTGASQDSFIFNQPQNVADQGYPVPLIYGSFRTGSVIINIGLGNSPIDVNATFAPNPVLNT